MRAGAEIEVVGADGHGIPLASVLTEDGNLIGTTDLNGVLADVKGAISFGGKTFAYKLTDTSLTLTIDGQQYPFRHTNGIKPDVKDYPPHCPRNESR
jgi:hypothetical protein